MDACVLEMLTVLMRRYMQTESQALAAGSHSHVLVMQGLFYLYGMARIGICRRTRTQWGTPDLRPVISVLPPDMQKAVIGAIRAEEAGRVCDGCGDCLHQREPSDFNLNVLESHYIWTIEDPQISLN